MDDEQQSGAVDAGIPDLGGVIERAVLNETDEGRRLAAAFVADFGEFVRTELRPVLRSVASNGDEPQLLVNGLAELLRATADSIEFPLEHPRAGSPSRNDPA